MSNHYVVGKIYRTNVDIFGKGVSGGIEFPTGSLVRAWKVAGEGKYVSFESIDGTHRPGNEVFMDRDAATPLS